MKHLFCVGAYYNLKFAPILPPVKWLSKNSLTVLILSLTVSAS
nr:MAG TPA: hypothetical protein [Caudoviricetes sp.]